MKRKYIWVPLMRIMHYVMCVLFIIAFTILSATFSSCEKTEVNPTNILKSDNSSPEGATVIAWLDGAKDKKATIQNNSYNISRLKIVTYDSITAEKNGYEKFSKGKTKVEGEVTLDINLIANGKYTTKFHITSNNQFFEDRLYKNMHPIAQETYDKNKPSPEGDSITWSVKKDKKWEVLAEEAIPKGGNVNLPLNESNSTLNTYKLKIFGQNIHPYEQEFSDINPQGNNEIINIKVAARFWAAMLGNIGPVANNYQSQGILMYMQYKNKTTKPEDMIMGISKGGTPSLESFTYVFLDIINENGSLREGVKLVDGKLVLEAEVGMYIPQIEAHPKLIKVGWQPKYTAGDVTIKDIFYQNKIMTDRGSYPLTQTFNISYPKRDINYQDFSIITLTEAGDTIVNAGGEFYHVIPNKYLPLFQTADGITLNNETYARVPLARKEEDRYEEFHHWVATKKPSIDAKLLATADMKVMKNGKLTSWGAPNSSEVIAAGTFTLKREEQPYKENEFGRKIYRTIGTITIPNTYQDFLDGK